MDSEEGDQLVGFVRWSTKLSASCTFLLSGAGAIWEAAVLREEVYGPERSSPMLGEKKGSRPVRVK